MFKQDTVDSIVSDLAEKVKKLSVLAESKRAEAVSLWESAQQAENDWVRASRITSKINELIS